MKRKTPRGVWALRGVTIAIALIVVFVIGAVAYSVYQDYSAVKTEFSSNPASVNIATSGNMETATLTVSVPNQGLFPLNVTMTCGTTNPYAQCSTAQVSVPPGGNQELTMKITITDAQRFASSTDRTINGTVDMSLEPFATLSIAVNYTGWFSHAGGP